MKRIQGMNPDYADYDELEDDAIGAERAYCEGIMTFDELSALIGADGAKAAQERKYGQDQTDPNVDTFDALDDWLDNEPFC